MPRPKTPAAGLPRTAAILRRLTALIDPLLSSSRFPSPSSQHNTSDLVDHLHFIRISRLERSFSSGCRFRDALQLFDEMLAVRPRLSAHHFNQHLKRVQRSGDYRMVVRLYERMVRDGEVSPDARVMVLNCLCQMGRVDVAFGILSDGLKKGDVLGNVVATSFMRGLCSLGQVENAFAVFKRMVKMGCDLDVVSHSVMITGFCWVGMVDLGSSLLGRMMKVGCLPDVITLSALIEGLCNADRTFDAFALFRRMEVIGCSPDVVIYTIIIRLCNRIGLIDLGLGLLGDALKKGCCIDTAILASLVHGLCMAGRISDAAILCKRMHELKRPVDVVTYGMLIDCACRLRCVDMAFAFLADMLRKGCVPNPAIFCALMNGLSMTNRIMDALPLIHGMASSGCDRDTVVNTAFLKGLCLAGYSRMAVELYREMRSLDSSCRPNLVTYGVIVDAFCKQGALDEVMEILKEMMDDGYFPNAVILSTLMDCFCKQGRMKDAHALFNLISGIGETPDPISHCILMHGYCLAGQVDAAMDIFHLMTVNGKVPDVHCYSVMISGYCKNNRIDEALELCRDMYVKGVMPDIVTYSIILDRFFWLGEPETVSNMLKEMAERVNFDIVTYSIIIDAHCKKHNLVLANVLLKWMIKMGQNPDLIFYNSLMNGYSLVNQEDTAYKTLENLLSSGFIPDVASYTVLLSSYCRNGKVHHAVRLFKTMLQHGPKPDAIAFTTLLKGLYDFGEVHEAINLFNDMQAHGVAPDRLTYIIMLNGLFKNHFFDEVNNLYQIFFIKRFQQQIGFFSILIEWLFRNGKDEVARKLFDSMLSEGSTFDEFKHCTKINVTSSISA